jgi:hypothetical protein
MMKLKKASSEHFKRSGSLGGIDPIEKNEQ